jgi:hypothetical protein
LKIRYLGKTPKIDIDYMAYQELVCLSKKVTGTILVLLFGEIKKATLVTDGDTITVKKVVIPKQMYDYNSPILDEVDVMCQLTDSGLGRPLGLGIICHSASLIKYPDDDGVLISTERKMVDTFISTYQLSYLDDFFTTIVLRPSNNTLDIRCCVDDVYTNVSFDSIPLTFHIDESVLTALGLVVKENVTTKGYSGTYDNDTPTYPKYPPAVKASDEKSALVKENPEWDKVV